MCSPSTIFELTPYLLHMGIILLVPDSCWSTIRNGNSISADLTEDTIKKWIERLLFLLFWHNLCWVFWRCTINTSNVRTCIMSIYIYSFSLRMVWLLFNAMWSFFQLYHDDNKLHDDVHFVEQHVYPYLDFIVLPHWNNNPWADMSLHSDTLSRIRSLLLLLKAVLLRRSKY